MNPIYRIKKRFRLSKRSKSFLLNIARTLMQLHHRIEDNREIATSHQSFVMTRDRLQGLIICFIGVGAFVVLNIMPIWGDYFFNCGELVYAARLAASAQYALLDGHFPLQYANDYDIVLRPIFLYYTPTYYGIAGLTQIITGLEPYRVMLILIIVMALSATCGTYFTTRLLGGGPVMSGIAAATLPISPYFMTDVFARGAFAELSAWAVFPWMAYCFIKFCCKPQMQSGLLFILTTGLLILCHKVFFPWAAIWLALLGLFLFGFRRMIALSPHFILCGSAALALTAPYWANAMLLGASLNIASAFNDVAFSSLTANLGVFSPVSYLHPLVAGYKNFNLQLGPLIVLSAIASLFYFRDGQIRALVLTTAVIALFVCSFFNALPFWKYLPASLLSIQFPYRLLMFATTFGIIAAGLVLTAVARDSRVYAYGIFCTALVLFFVSFWWRVDISHTHVSHFYNVDFANTGDAYFENDGPKPAVNQAPLPRSLINASGNRVTAAISTIHGGSVALPVQYSRRLTTLINGKPSDISSSNGLVSIVLPAGTSNIYVRRDEPVGFVTGIGIAGILIAALGFLLRRPSKQSTQPTGAALFNRDILRSV
jgi:hypothetical protein